MPSPASPLGANRLLRAIPQNDLDRLSPRLERQQTGLKDVLFQPNMPIEGVYFPLSGVVSIITVVDNDRGIELATVGREGMVGVPLFLGARYTSTHEISQVHIPGELIHMSLDTFNEESRPGGPLYDIVRRYTQAFISQISRHVACNRLHSVEQRFSRWLLWTHDRVSGDDFPMTHEFLSQMLGVRRHSVTAAAGRLQSAGVIRYRRGRMSIVDRDGLEGTCCECYRIIRKEFDRLIG